MQSEMPYSNCMHVMRSEEIRSHLRKQSRSDAEKCMEDIEKQNELLKALLDRKKRDMDAHDLAYRYFMMKLWERIPCYVKPCIRDASAPEIQVSLFEFLETHREMDKSFSLHFNPITDIKTIKEYEKELEKLRSENFSIKHELSYYKSNRGEVSPDIKQLIEDSHRSIEILEREKAQIMKKYEDDVKCTRERILAMENENKRLVMCIERLNSDNERMKMDNQRLGELIAQQQGLDESNKVSSAHVVAENERLKSLVSQMSHDVKSKEDALRHQDTAYQEKLRELQDRADGMEREKEELGCSLKKYEEEMGGLREALGNRDTRLAKLEEYGRELEAAVKERERCIYELREKEGAYKTDLERTAGELSYEQGLRREREREIGMLKAQIHEIQSILGRYEREFERIRSQAEDKENAMRKRLQSLCSKESELESFYNQEVKKYEAENNELKNQFHILKNRYQHIMRQAIDCVFFEAEKVRGVKEDILRLRGSICKLIVLKNSIAGDRRRALEDKSALSHEKKRLAEELEVLKSEVARAKEKETLPERCMKFLNSIGLSGNEDRSSVVMHFAKMHSELMDRIRVMEKEIGEITYFAENNKNVLHIRTLRLLDNFTREFSSAKTELEECKAYLEKKNREIKVAKKEKIEFDNKLRVAERKRDELQNVLVRMRDRYNSVEKELRCKSEIISKLQTKINAHFS
ncbi:UNVERIFIED_CONTAM: hypothetical protein PYX00_011853 [Menopon gallinae]|uniref:Uncharacterized protein n=1 Tax=Menopon gallinae TaxID=328185 RepID=A0AAW2H8X4_9NEOP